ncbi:unnamed protein product [Blepharisma stoltei]|uniref:Uncharacterized protein n=1 Tax=Blepharisma stoltei TaxID=1481888 RepID=A0AAU9JV34_9CILI|nr:unnamed protein product [Blepharisma stoltei]
MSSRASNTPRATTKYPESRAYFSIEDHTRKDLLNILIQIKKIIMLNAINSLEYAKWEAFTDSIVIINKLLLILIKSKQISIRDFYKSLKQAWLFILQEWDLINDLYGWNIFSIIFQKLIMHFISVSDNKRMKKCLEGFILISEKFEIFNDNYLDFLNLLITGYYDNIDEEIIRLCLNSLKIIEKQPKKYEINMGNLELSIITWSLMIGEEKYDENVENLLKLDWDIDDIWYDTIEKLIWKLFIDEKHELALLLDKKLKEAYNIKIKNFPN